MTVKSSARVGYLNAILAQGGGNLNNSIFKSSNARGLPGGGMLMFRIDRRITSVNGVINRFIDKVRHALSEPNYLGRNFKNKELKSRLSIKVANFIKFRLKMNEKNRCV